MTYSFAKAAAALVVGCSTALGASMAQAQSYKNLMTDSVPTWLALADSADQEQPELDQNMILALDEPVPEDAKLYRKAGSEYYYASPETIMPRILRDRLENRSLKDDYRTSSDRWPVSVGAHIGTMGVGVNATFMVDDRISVTGIYEHLDTEIDGNVSWWHENGTHFSDYKAQVDSDSYTALLNFHPNRGAFRFSTGVTVGAPGIDAVASQYLSNGAEAVARGSTNSEWDMGPYFGIGFGSQKRSTSGLVVYGDLGVSYMGEVDYDTDVACAGGPADECARFADNFVDSIDMFGGEYIMPVARLGVAYRF